MRSTVWKFATFAVAVAALVVACGARSGLIPPETTSPDDAAVVDASPRDAAPPPDARPADTCVPTCNSADLAHVYNCGVPIAQCGSLEQCEVRGGTAVCINPCNDTLGNDTSNGCEFYAVEVDTAPEVDGVCYAVFIVNQWKTGEPARIAIDRGGQMLPIEQFARIPRGKGAGITYQPYDPNAGLAQNEIAILFLSRDPTAVNDTTINDPRVLAGCPAGVQPAVSHDASLHGTGIGTAFHIRTNVPVVAYQMLPYGGGRARVTGATLLLPINTWDLNYVVADAYPAPAIAEARVGPVTVVIASKDGTRVTIKPTADIVAGGGLASAAAGTSVNYMLDAGQYLQFTQPVELTGSALEADQPVGVIGASTLMDVPLMPLATRADSAEQMLPPIKALGSEYVAARFRSRSAPVEESVPWRIVAAADGTLFTYEPSRPAGAPTQASAGQLFEFQDPGPFVVRSQDADHPFYFASYMTGGINFGGRGDPDFVNVVPPAQYLPQYTFFTDPTYPETNLVIVRKRSADTGLMPDVSLDCAGVLGGWQAVGSSGTYEMTRVDLSTGMFQGVGGCDNGVHTITGTAVGSCATPPCPPPVSADGGLVVAEFGVTVWGWGNEVTYAPDNNTEDESNPLFTRWVSYGYPAGANFRALNVTHLSAR